MSIRAKLWSYVGKHCHGACTLSRKGQMCQCKFDRNYERQCMENPGGVKPFSKLDNVIKRVKDAKAKNNTPAV